MGTRREMYSGQVLVERERENRHGQKAVVELDVEQKVKTVLQHWSLIDKAWRESLEGWDRHLWETWS